MLASMDARLPLGGIADVAGAISRSAQGRRARRPGAGRGRIDRALARQAARAPAGRFARKVAGSPPCARASSIADLGHVYHPILEAFWTPTAGSSTTRRTRSLGPLRRAVAAVRAPSSSAGWREALVDERFAPYLQDAYYTQREGALACCRCAPTARASVRGIVHGNFSQSGQGPCSSSPEGHRRPQQPAQARGGRDRRRHAREERRIPRQAVGVGRGRGRRDRRRARGRRAPSTSSPPRQ